MRESLMLLENPYRRRKRRRNPAKAGALALPGTAREWTQGVDLMDAGCAVGGLAASTMLPGLLIKPSAGATELTTMQKILKVVVSLGAAVGAGALGKAMISPKAGKAAVIGGIAGTAAQALGMFTGIKIGQPKMLGTPRRLGVTETISPRMTSEGEQTSVILP